MDDLGEEVESNNCNEDKLKQMKMSTTTMNTSMMMTTKITKIRTRRKIKITPNSVRKPHTQLVLG